MNTQGQLDFDSGNSGDGHARWQAERRQAVLDLARQVGLPLNHQVEVWLAGGIRLRGKLQLQEEKLFLDAQDARNLRLRVDTTPFTVNEMESCVRLD